MGASWQGAGMIVSDRERWRLVVARCSERNMRTLVYISELDVLQARPGSLLLFRRGWRRKVVRILRITVHDVFSCFLWPATLACSTIYQTLLLNRWLVATDYVNMGRHADEHDPLIVALEDITSRGGTKIFRSCFENAALKAFLNMTHTGENIYHPVTSTPRSMLKGSEHVASTWLSYVYDAWCCCKDRLDKASDRSLVGENGAL